MLPILLTLAIALAAAAVAFLAITLVGRWRVKRRVGKPSDVRTGTRVAELAAAAVGLALTALIVGALAISVERETFVVNFDERVERWASQQAGQLSTDVLRAITHLGDTVVVAAITVIAVGVLVAFGRRRLALFLGTAVLGQWLLANGIKEVVARTRPELDPLSAFSGFSFPSGHSTAAAATYLALAVVVVNVRPGHDGRWVLAFGVGIATAVAASRALLGVHWFTDVVGGLVLGWAWCLICARLWAVPVVPHSPESNVQVRSSGRERP